MSDEENLTRHPPVSPSAVAGRLAAIGGIVFASALDDWFQMHGTVKRGRLMARNLPKSP